ncbi:MAG: YkgJ family cysteine cluster protein [Alphaproteobacteria bacterium]|nr:YkgJ family cysteine cluster protein [Alphaproteobacteria bacterium]
MKIADTNFEPCKDCTTGGCCAKFDVIGAPVFAKSELEKIKTAYSIDESQFDRIGDPELIAAAKEYKSRLPKKNWQHAHFDSLLAAMKGSFYHPAIRDDGSCSLLGEKGCTIYYYRPLDCVLFPFTVYINERCPENGLWLFFDPTHCCHDDDTAYWRLWIKAFIIHHAAQALEVARQYSAAELLEYATISHRTKCKFDASILLPIAPIFNKER